jgi:hypothetical protein
MERNETPIDSGIDNQEQLISMFKDSNFSYGQYLTVQDYNTKQKWDVYGVIEQSNSTYESLFSYMGTVSARYVRTDVDFTLDTTNIQFIDTIDIEFMIY